MDEYNKDMIVSMFFMVMQGIFLLLTKDEKEEEKLRKDLIDLSEELEEWKS